MRIAGVVRCELCSRTESVDRSTPDKRPDFGSRDRFFAFQAMPTESVITGKADGRFNGIGTASDNKTPYPLHACPGCRTSFLAFNKSLTRDTTLLPQGLFRQFMETIKPEIRRDIKFI